MMTAVDLLKARCMEHAERAEHWAKAEWRRRMVGKPRPRPLDGDSAYYLRLRVALDYYRVASLLRTAAYGRPV